jgi:hypothetical protein
MPYIAAPDLVRCADGDAGAFGAEVALFLDNDYDAVACASWSVYSQSAFLLSSACVPTLAARFERSTLTHSTMAAPELSMQLTRV